MESINEYSLMFTNFLPTLLFLASLWLNIFHISHTGPSISQTEKKPIVKDHSDIFKCAKTMAKFYMSNLQGFDGEKPASKLKQLISNVLNQFEDITIIDVGANKGQILNFIDHSNAT